MTRGPQKPDMSKNKLTIDEDLIRKLAADGCAVSCHDPELTKEQVQALGFTYITEQGLLTSERNLCGFCHQAAHIEAAALRRAFRRRSPPCRGDCAPQHEQSYANQAVNVRCPLTDSERGPIVVGQGRRKPKGTEEKRP